MSLDIDWQQSAIWILEICQLKNNSIHELDCFGPFKHVISKQLIWPIWPLWLLKHWEKSAHYFWPSLKLASVLVRLIFFATLSITHNARPLESPALLTLNHFTAYLPEHRDSEEIVQGRCRRRPLRRNDPRTRRRGRRWTCWKNFPVSGCILGRGHHWAPNLVFRIGFLLH